MRRSTAGFSLIALAVSFLFGLPAAWLVERTDFPGKTVLLTLMTVGWYQEPSGAYFPSVGF